MVSEKTFKDFRILYRYIAQRQGQITPKVLTVRKQFYYFNSFDAKFQMTFVICLFYFNKLTFGKTFICEIERLNVKQRRSRWDGSMSCLIWIYAVCKSLLLSPVAVKELLICCKFQPLVFIFQLFPPYKIWERIFDLAKKRLKVNLWPSFEQNW